MATNEALALKYRPKTFSDCVGQSSVIKILERQIATKTFKNAYLFSGQSGGGKTSMQRIMANLINNGKGSPIEIDAASNSGVDNIRQVIQTASERALDSEYKVIIVDEVHALQGAAFQALLKTLEEPPKYTIFFLCTTDPQKIPATILSRVQRFNFTKIPTHTIRDRLDVICRHEGFTGYEESIDYISKMAQGSMRQAIAYLEKIATLGNVITIENTLDSLGTFSYDKMFDLVNACGHDDEPTILNIVEHFYNEGNDLKLFIEQYLSFVLNIYKYSLLHNMDLLAIPASMEEQIKTLTDWENSSAYYFWICDKILTLKNLLKNDTQPKETIEVKLLAIARGVQ